MLRHSAHAAASITKQPCLSRPSSSLCEDVVVEVWLCPEHCCLLLTDAGRSGVDTDQDVADTLSVLHGALRDRGLLVVGYNKPTNFRYWTGGLLPLFDNATLGLLPHEVCLLRCAGGR